MRSQPREHFKMFSGHVSSFHEVSFMEQCPTVYACNCVYTMIVSASAMLPPTVEQLSIIVFVHQSICCVLEPNITPLVELYVVSCACCLCYSAIRRLKMALKRSAINDK